MASAVKKVLDPFGLLGGGSGKAPPAGAASVAGDAPPGAEAAELAKQQGLEHRENVRGRASGASVALANEDREVLGAGRQLGRSGRAVGGVGRRTLGSLG